MNELDTHSMRDFVLTYRYLRVTMIAVLLMLGASVLWQGVQADCWLGSVSAYYYTPVRNVFVGALFVFGAALIAYHGSTPEEETVLNLSGFMALVVALVPTVPDGCGALPDDAEVINNIASLAIAAVLALGLVKVINRDRGEPEANSQAGQASGIKGGWHAWLTRRLSSLRTWWPDHGQKVLVLLCSIVPPAMFAFFLVGRETFISVAHTLAAVIMVFGLILYMIFNAVLVDHDPETLGIVAINYKKVYQFLAAVLGLVMIGIGIAAATVGLSLWIFILEFGTLGIFAIYWLVQSFELRSRIAKGAPRGDADVIDHLGLGIPPTRIPSAPATSTNGQPPGGPPTAPTTDKSDDVPADAN